MEDPGSPGGTLPTSPTASPVMALTKAILLLSLVVWLTLFAYQMSSVWFAMNFWSIGTNTKEIFHMPFAGRYRDGNHMPLVCAFAVLPQYEHSDQLNQSHFPKPVVPLLDVASFSQNNTKNHTCDTADILPLWILGT
jgi:hypothetical protein